jgi:hypothetical protein
MRHGRPRDKPGVTRETGPRAACNRRLASRPALAYIALTLYIAR